jgi:3'-5' exonuclease
MFAARTCAFDVEWAPCPDTARRLLKLPPQTSDAEAVAAVWARYAKEDDARPFLKLALSKVLSIAAIFRTRDKDGTVHLTLAACGVNTLDEGALIGRFLERVASGRYQLWGFNSGASDLPILRQRAIALGVPCPQFAGRPTKPWEGFDYFDTRTSDAHMDILQLLSGFNRGAAMPSLDEFCAACGLPGKLNVSGGEVADLFLQGEVQRIVEYNETDALTTHLVALRLALHAGKLNAEEYRQEINAAHALLDTQIALGKAQFVKFAAAWPKEPAFSG